MVEESKAQRKLLAKAEDGTLAARGKEADERYLATCVECNQKKDVRKGKWPLAVAPAVWRCNACVYCHHCDAREPGAAADAKWYRDFTSCKRCHNRSLLCVRLSDNHCSIQLSLSVSFSCSAPTTATNHSNQLTNRTNHSNQPHQPAHKPQTNRALYLCRMYPAFSCVLCCVYAV